MFSLGIRKLLVIAGVALILLSGNIILVANWLESHGITKWAGWVRQEFLTGTAITILIALLILLTGRSGGESQIFSRKCEVCGHRVSRRNQYCSDCGSKL